MCVFVLAPIHHPSSKASHIIMHIIYCSADAVKSIVVIFIHSWSESIVMMGLSNIQLIWAWLEIVYCVCEVLNPNVVFCSSIMHLFKKYNKHRIHRTHSKREISLCTSHQIGNPWKPARCLRNEWLPFHMKKGGRSNVQPIGIIRNVRICTRPLRVSVLNRARNRAPSDATSS